MKPVDLMPRPAHTLHTTSRLLYACGCAEWGAHAGKVANAACAWNFHRAGGGLPFTMPLPECVICLVQPRGVPLPDPQPLHTEFAAP